MPTRVSAPRRAAAILFACLPMILGIARPSGAHPLGNFTINHFARLQVGEKGLRLRYVVDMAEIPAFQELQKIGAAEGKTTSQAALAAFAWQAATRYAQNIVLTSDETPLFLTPVGAKALPLPGAGGLPTLRVECDLTGALLATGESVPANGIHHLRFEDGNNPSRIGWREIVVVPMPGIALFDSSAYGSAITDELKAYPQDRIAAPLAESTAIFSWRKGSVPPGGQMLRARDGRAVSAPAPDRFAALIAVQTVTPAVALLGLLFAFLWGAGHAFTPGHGKTIVGAYLVGSRGTARHAFYLGATVTITHTLGVFALGLVTLFASRYIVPERLFPILSFLSGGIVLVLGVSLFVQRASAMLGFATHSAVGEDDELLGEGSAPHSHGGYVYPHLPSDAEGEPITWRSLLTIGISGGLLPCPSALVVLLSAVALHRIVYGLMLVFAFSLGLAGTLTCIGLAFLQAGKLMTRLQPGLARSSLMRLLPALSALFVAGAGTLICWQATRQGSFALFSSGPMRGAQPILGAHAALSPGFLSALVILGLGLLVGLRYAWGDGLSWAAGKLRCNIIRNGGKDG